MLNDFDDLGGFGSETTGLRAASLTQQFLDNSRELVGVVLDALPVALLIHTEQGVLFANKEACSLLGSDKARISGKHFLDFIEAQDAPEVSQLFRRAFEQPDGTLTRECVIAKRDGTTRLASVIFGRLPWPGNPVIQILFRDITDQKRAESSLRQLTITDELTGAYNRRHAFYEASLYLDGFATTRLPLTVALIDIDHFKRINDTYGHHVGDLALQQLTILANEFIPTIRETDSAIFARIGGEEFVLLLPGIAIGKAAAIAERLRKRIAALVVATPAGDVGFTVSMGLASLGHQDRNFEQMLGRADAALYAAKSGGRNRVVAQPPEA